MKKEPKPRIKISDIKSKLDAFAVWVATASGAGFFPKAPGTAGTAMALPLAYWIAPWSDLNRVAVWIFLLVLGTWSSKHIDRMTGTADNQSIVIDEVVGLGITAFTVGRDFKALGLCFVLFRIFDVVKLPPARQMDHFSKKRQSPWWRGFGVMADDVIAGFQGLLIILLIQKYFPQWISV